MSYKLETIKKGTLDIMTSPRLFKERSVFIGFTNRNGGLSEGSYSSLNLAFHVGDNEKNVLKNREISARSFGYDILKLSTGKQVHDSNIKVVNNENAGCGSKSYKDAFDSTDGLITSYEGLAISIQTADCLPLIFVNKKPQKIGVFHCGWKSITGGIIEKASKEFNIKNTIAFFGPAIDSCCYEVEKDVADSLGSSTNENKKYNISLADIVFEKLINMGMNKKNVYLSNICTSCNVNKYFSYRAEGKITGRQSAIAVIFPENMNE